MSDDDWDLFLAWRDGDKQAAERLISRHFKLLTRFFINKVGSIDAATDLVSDTFLVCTANRDRVRQLGSFRSYLIAIAMNKLREHHRCQAKRQREFDDFRTVCVADTHPPTPDTFIDQTREVQLLVRALRRLTLDQQIVLELYFFEAVRGPEIAELLGIPQATVYTLIRRGRAQLEALIAKFGTDPELVESTVRGLDSWIAEIHERLSD